VKVKNWEGPHKSITGADPGFQVKGAHLKNCAERREARKCLGYFVRPLDPPLD